MEYPAATSKLIPASNKGKNNRLGSYQKEHFMIYISFGKVEPSPNIDGHRSILKICNARGCTTLRRLASVLSTPLVFTFLFSSFWVLNPNKKIKIKNWQDRTLKTVGRYVDSFCFEILWCLLVFVSLWRVHGTCDAVKMDVLWLMRRWKIVRREGLNTTDIKVCFVQNVCA